MANCRCVVCNAEAVPFRKIDGFDYFECPACSVIFIEPRVLDDIDAGRHLRDYDESYWKEQISPSRQRSYGSSLARVAEVLLYARRPVRRFLDIGCGPGFLLDALATYLPGSDGMFYGVELFPPPQHTAHPNYIVGGISDAGCQFEAGCCIEVLEHLTPKMVDRLAHDLALASAEEAIYIFNTGLDSFVRAGHADYLDPLRIGHIVSWSLRSLARIFSRHGFRVLPLRGKPWAFCIEYGTLSSPPEPLLSRIWSPMPENRKILDDHRMGSVMYILGLESAKAYPKL
jgi:SAM-dependent methyltransferase